MAIIDSAPVPTFGGPDILIAILVSAHRDVWYEYAAAATGGSTIGAYFTFRLARKAGHAYLVRNFGHPKAPAFLRIFEKWSTPTLVASTAIPFPFPTSLVFAAAGVSDYHLGKFLGVVVLSRASRYIAVAILTDVYGGRVMRVIRHPTQYWGWFLLLCALIFGVIAAAIFVHRRLTAERAARP